jgi:hypothetical protein
VPIDDELLDDDEDDDENECSCTLSDVASGCVTRKCASSTFDFRLFGMNLSPAEEAGVSEAESRG